ncbi:MAG: single-stranded DNA-binding protein [Candidatus Caenarcaniphilales bacterium]|nr:single-stranded DNA-binding protein [Candidatus Caenarcaniphilales bacterium]
MNQQQPDPFFSAVTVVGRAGSDAELKYFDSGAAKAEVSVAVDRGKTRDGQDLTDWFKIVFWGKTAEIAGKYVKKGGMIGVDGAVVMDRWTDKASGEQRYAYSIKANNLRLLSSKREMQEMTG